MALCVITGAANVGKSGAVREYLAAALASGGDALLLLPSRPDVSRSLAELSSLAPVGVSAATFDGYLDGLWRSLGDGRALITPSQRGIILSRVARRHRMGESGRSLESPGYVKLLTVLVQRAAERHVVLDDTAMRSSVLAGGPGQVLLECAAEYKERLPAAGLIERAEAHRLVIEQLSEKVLPGAIAVHRFTGFTTAQLAFIERAAPLADELVTLTFDASVPATAAAAVTLKKLGEIGRIRHVGAADDYSTADELVRIERRLGGVGDASVRADGAVVFSESWGEDAEAARVVCEVQRACDAGIPPERIAVVFRDAGRRFHSLDAALAEAGIEREWDVRIPFGRVALGRAVLAILGLDAQDRATGAVIDLLRSPYSPATDEMLDVLDVRLRRANGVSWQRLLDWCGQESVAARAFLEEARRAAGFLVGERAERRWHHLLLSMLGRARSGSVTDDESFLADASVVRALMETLVGMRVFEDRPLSAGDLAGVLKDTVVTLRSRERVGYVQIMSAERVRGRRFECVILGGLNAGEFPPQEREGALTAPDVGEAFAAAGIDVSQRSTTEGERLLFYQTVTRASRRLVLSRQSHDADGVPLRPSIFLEEVLDLYRDPKGGAFFAGEPPCRALRPDLLTLVADGPVTDRRVRRASISQAASTQALSGGPDASSSVKREPQALRESCWHDRQREARRRAAASPPVLAHEALDRLRGRRTFSASEIETYLQCPFRWYVERVLRPREIDADLDAAASGRIAHEIMRRFYEEFLARAGVPRVTPTSLSFARAIHKGVVDRVLDERSVGTVADEADLRAVALGTARLVEADATFLPGMVPAWTEWSFGLDPDDDPEPVGDFGLVGRVDRIDANEAQLVITDYKSGNIDGTRAKRAFGRQGLVQLPLYALVASRRLGLEIAGGIYRSVKGGRPRGFIEQMRAGDGFVSTDASCAAEIDDLVADAVDRAQRAVTSMRAGNIDPAPSTGKCPSYCGARAFCTGWRPD